MTKEEMYDILIECEIVTEEEIAIAIYFNGFNKGTMEDILFFKTGYRTFEQFLEEGEE